MRRNMTRCGIILMVILLILSVSACGTDGTDAELELVMREVSPPVATFDNYDLFEKDGKAFIRIKKPIVEYSSDGWGVFLPATTKLDSIAHLKESIISGNADDGMLRHLLPFTYRQSDPPHEIEIVNLNYLFVPDVEGAQALNVWFGKTYYVFSLTLDCGIASLTVESADRAKEEKERMYEDVYESEHLPVVKTETIDERNATVILRKNDVTTVKNLIYTVKTPYGRYTVCEEYLLESKNAPEYVNESAPQCVSLYCETGGSVGFTVSLYDPTERPSLEMLASIGIREFEGNPKT